MKHTPALLGAEPKPPFELLDGGVVRQLRGGTRPKYDLLPWHLLRGNDRREPLTPSERKIFERVVRGAEIVSQQDRKQAARAVANGWLINHGDGWYSVAPDPPGCPDWIWLPNELVTSAAGETPPIELVRQAQDVMTLRLLVDLYHAQNLREDGGISREITWEHYDRVKVGQQGPYDVWGFASVSIYANCVGPAVCHWRDELTREEQKAGKNEAVDFFPRLNQLGDLGLMQWILHLVESDGPDAEIIHQVGAAGSDDLEFDLGLAAEEAALAMLCDELRAYAEKSELRLVPVLRHLASVQMIGIARLRYRPHTRLTAAWWQEINTKGEKYLAQCQALVRRIG